MLNGNVRIINRHRQLHRSDSKLLRIFFFVNLHRLYRSVMQATNAIMP